MGPRKGFLAVPCRSRLKTASCQRSTGKASLPSMPRSRRSRLREPRGRRGYSRGLSGILVRRLGPPRRAVTRLAGDGLINAVLIDVKDVIGRVGYDAKVPEPGAHGARVRAIADLESVVDRMAMFKDTKLAGARPRRAIHSRRAQRAVGPPHLAVDKLWRKAHRAWLDPVAEDAWAYNGAIAAEVFRAGFDEVKLDYIRFSTDRDLRDMHIPMRRAAVSCREVLRTFCAYFRERFSGRRLSADLFGLVTVA